MDRLSVSQFSFGLRRCDRIGRKPVFLLGAVFTIVFGIPMFLMINGGVVVLIVVAVVLALLLSHDPIFAVEASWFTEQFPANVRSSGDRRDS